MKRALAIAAVLFACAPAAHAQKATPAPGRSLSVALRLARPWFGPASPVTVEIELTSRLRDPLSSLRLSVALYERVRSRSSLREAFEGKLPRSPLDASTFAIDDLPPGVSQKVRIERRLDEMRAFQGAPAGLYPLAVTLRQNTGPGITTVTTAVALITDVTQNPIALLPVLVVAPTPILEPDGTPNRGTRDALASLRRGLGTLPQQGNAQYGLAASPVLLDELAALRTSAVKAEAAAVEDALRQAAAAAEVLTMPYSYTDLRQLPELAGTEAVVGQLGAGRAATRRALRGDPAPLLVPPHLHADLRTIAAARDNELRAVVVPGSLVGSASRGLTPADAVQSDGVLLLPSDALLEASLTKARTDVDLGRILAETAMVYFEAPARQRTLVVPALVESFDGAIGRFSSFLAGLQDSPWVRVVSPSAALTVDARPLRNPRYPAPTRAPRTFVRTLADARRAVDELTAITLSGNQTAESLRTSLQAALGTAWWEGGWERGNAYARRISSAVARQRRLVSTVGTAPVTFTSRRGEVPITIVNRTAYPVRIRVDVTSPKLKFPDGSTRVLEPLNPPGRTVTFAALAEATGTFPLRVRLASTDGSVTVHEEEFVVRSTAFNVVALAITLGAAAFLVVWYGRRFVSARRAPRTAA
jgi:hypothetical protein